MAHPISLDAVIRKVASADRLEDNERLVIVEAKTKRSVPRRGIFGEYGQYLVRSNADPRNEACLTFDRLPPVRDMDHQVAVVMVLQLSCPPGREPRVAEALFDAKRSPAEVLAASVERWLGESWRAVGLQAFVARYFADRAGLERDIAELVTRDTGMQAGVRLSLPGEKSLESISIEVPSLPVLVRDYDEEQELGLRVTLEVDQQNRAAAVLHFPRNVELPQQVRAEVRRYVRQSLTLQELCTAVTTGTIEASLAAHLNGVLAPAGRRVGALVLQVRGSGAVHSSPTFEVAVRCRVHEFPEEIVIKNTVLLLLRDLARYRRAGAPPLREWLQEKLDATIPQLLFDTRYIDLLIDFAPIEARVKEALKAEAEAIGYEIKQFVTAPDLSPIRLRETFEIDTIGAFETNLRGVDVKLQVVVSARIPRLEQIKEFLNRHQDVKQLMEEAIHASLRERLHGMDPERIYMRFNHSDPAEYPGETPVQQELGELVRRRLQDQEFHADVISITIKMVETQLIERFNQLQARICPFSVKVASFHGGPTVVFRGNFRVVSVDPKGWHTFQLLQCELAEIQAQVETHLLARLETRHAAELGYRGEKHRAEIEGWVTKAAIKFASVTFGLAIEVTNVRRELTEIESATSADEQADYLARLALNQSFRGDRLLAEQQLNHARLEQIQELLKRRAERVGLEGIDDEIKDIDAKIEQLRSSLGETRIPTHDDLRVQVLGAPPPPALALPVGVRVDGAGDGLSSDV